MKSKAFQGREPGASRRHESVGVICLGVGLVAATVVLSVAGVHSAVNAIQSSALQDQMAYLQMMADLNSSQTTKDYAAEQGVSFGDTAYTTPMVHTTGQQQGAVTDSSGDSWSSPQLEWALANHITWDENGNPVNENGEIVDDPTTVIDERTRVAASQSANGGTNVSDPSPATATNWWDGLDFIQVDELGQPYCLIKSGDTLSKLAAKTGFTVPEIADCNHITNANNLRVGQKILFPENGPTVTNPNTGLG